LRGEKVTEKRRRGRRPLPAVRYVHIDTGTGSEKWFAEPPVGKYVLLKVEIVDDQVEATRTWKRARSWDLRLRHVEPPGSGWWHAEDHETYTVWHRRRRDLLTDDELAKAALEFAESMWEG
jgi:hypothetical protein